MTQDITQLPWNVYEHLEGDYYGTLSAVLGFDKNNIRQIRTIGIICKNGGSDEAKANAAFIVRACNNHKALLDALKSMRANFEPFTSRQIDCENPLERIEYDAQITASELARTAIANAEKE